MGSANFWRLRIGIGHPGHKDQVTPYVLNPPSQSDYAKIMKAIEEACALVPECLAGEMQRAMQLLHQVSQ